ncbi:flavin reductase family protein [Bacillus salitolerans]|uniref:Flavin reductase family protein n=1 Tax=Bacillus salitolerans TaxID=1437434 RepID=A0ABW4LN60_9BACI
MLKSTNKTVMHSYPGMVSLVTSHFQGALNIMAAGWHTYLSYEPAIYGVAIAKERHTHSLVKESGEFAVHFMPGHFADKIQQSGTLSGKDTQKLETLNLVYKKGEIINSPILQDAYVAMSVR